MIKNRIKNIISIAFNVNEELIDKNFGPSSCKKWDSLNHIKLCISLEKEFKIKFSDSELETLINYEIIYKTIKTYLL